MVDWRPVDEGDGRTGVMDLSFALWKLIQEKREVIAFLALEPFRLHLDGDIAVVVWGLAGKPSIQSFIHRDVDIV